MKAHTAILLALLLPLAARADEMLKNTDFADGTSHWSGDGESAAASDAAPSKPGLIVKLRHSWTKVTQGFPGKTGQYTFTMTYSVEPGTSFSTDPNDFRRVVDQLGLTALKSFWITPGQWVVIMIDPAAGRFTFSDINPVTADGAQTITSDFNLDSDGDKKICLGFPPGTGSVTLINVSLKPKTAAPTATPASPATAPQAAPPQAGTGSP